jgi:carbamoyl-phosphate synthase/aspartate carbamoyltransferase
LPECKVSTTDLWSFPDSLPRIRNLLLDFDSQKMAYPPQEIPAAVLSPKELAPSLPISGSAQVAHADVPSIGEPAEDFENVGSTGLSVAQHPRSPRSVSVVRTSSGQTGGLYPPATARGLDSAELDTPGALETKGQAVKWDDKLDEPNMVLELADGLALSGHSFGAEGKSIAGECVFQTGQCALFGLLVRGLVC